MAGRLSHDYRDVGRVRGTNQLPAPPPLVEAATLISGIGNGIALVALPWLVLKLTGWATAAGSVVIATALPLIVSPVRIARTRFVSEWRQGTTSAILHSALPSDKPKIVP